MAGPIFLDRVQETSSTTGTSSYALSGATTGFQSFAGVGNGNTAYYVATDNVSWEVGLGTYSTSGPTLARTTIIASSSGTSPINWGTGARLISLVSPAQLYTNLLAEVLPSGGAAGQILAKNTATNYDVVWINNRAELTGNRTYFVSTTGSDSNDGLSAGAPFLTLQHALNVIQTLDFSTFNVTIQLADGTYTGNNTLTGPWAGSGALTIQGNASDPSLVILSTSGACFSNSGLITSSVTLQHMTLTSSASSCIVNNGMGKVNFSDIVFGSASSYHISASGNGAAQINATGNYAISGGANRHFNSQNAAQINAVGRTVTFLASVTISTFAFAFLAGDITANTMTFTLGSFTVTGTRYSISSNSVCFVNGAGASYFPGSTAGATATGGQYV